MALAVATDCSARPATTSSMAAPAPINSTAAPATTPMSWVPRPTPSTDRRHGIDTITSTITRSLAAFATVENLTLLGTSAINGTGNALANTITGNGGRQHPRRRRGVDIADRRRAATTPMSWVPRPTPSMTLPARRHHHLDHHSFARVFRHDREPDTAGTAAINGTGNALANTITGNGAANTLDGGARQRHPDRRRRQRHLCAGQQYRCRQRHGGQRPHQLHRSPRSLARSGPSSS